LGGRAGFASPLSLVSLHANPEQAAAVNVAEPVRTLERNAIPHDPRVPRLHAPTAEQFYDQFVRRGRPVVLTGVASQWPAFAKWTPDYLRRVAGNQNVSVHYDEEGDFQRWYSPRSAGDRQMRFGEFLDIVTGDKPDRRYYVSEHGLHSISEKLVDDVDILGRFSYITGKPAVFVGRDTMMPLHYHGTTEAVCCQLVGEKEFVLFAPRDTPRMYAHPWWSNHWHFSRIDVARQASVFTNTDHLGYAMSGPDRFPRYSFADPFRIALHAGEILFIPVHWWHVTTCPGFQVNVVWFFPSSMRRWHWPSPGLQMLARLAKFRLRHGLRRPLDTYAR
jgi:hypothetical protein